MRVLFLVLALTIASAKWFDDAEIKKHVTKYSKYYKDHIIDRLQDQVLYVDQITRTYHTAMITPNNEQMLADWKTEFENSHFKRYDEIAIGYRVCMIKFEHKDDITNKDKMGSKGCKVDLVTVRREYDTRDKDEYKQFIARVDAEIRKIFPKREEDL